MTDLKTTFAGLSLRNPIIISSSGLTNSVGKNKKLAEDGAGAIVLKSLFEEQIMLEADQLKDPAFYPEASDYLEEYIREHKLSEYLTLIKESKKEQSEEFENIEDEQEQILQNSHENDNSEKNNMKLK